MPKSAFDTPIPIQPARSLDDIEAILDTYTGGPIVTTAGKDGVAHARRLHLIARRYRERLIRIRAETEHLIWAEAAERVDSEVLG